jgi:hypothetical protein
VSICWCGASQRNGSDLLISRHYISHGLRSQAVDLVSAELGPKPEYEISPALEREVDAERWTRLDVAIRMAADDTGFIDLRPDQPGANDPEARRLAIGRLQRLERRPVRHTTTAWPWSRGRRRSTGTSAAMSPASPRRAAGWGGVSAQARARDLSLGWIADGRAARQLIAGVRAAHPR